MILNQEEIKDISIIETYKKVDKISILCHKNKTNHIDSTFVKKIFGIRKNYKYE